MSIVCNRAGLFAQVAADAPNTSVYNSSENNPFKPEKVSTQSVSTRLLNKRPDLNLTDRVVVSPLTQRSEGGGYGDVFRGTLEVEDGEPIRVAVKRLRIKIGSSDGELARLKRDIAREFKIWSELEHPNIIPLLGYTIEGSYPSFVSTWMDYGSLYRYMHLRKLKGVDSLSMALDISCGVAYLHSRSVIHSDLKSDNVLVSPDGRAVLTDFGASRMEYLSSGCSTFSYRGTLQWTAPELFPLSMDDDDESLPQFTFETDVWAFGMTVYEILSKERPYAGIRSIGTILCRIVNGKLPKKPTLSGDISDAKVKEFMWSICEDCWKRDPKARPSMHDIELQIRKNNSVMP